MITSVFLLYKSRYFHVLYYWITRESYQDFKKMLILFVQYQYSVEMMRK